MNRPYIAEEIQHVSVDPQDPIIQQVAAGIAEAVVRHHGIPGTIGILAVAFVNLAALLITENGPMPYYNGVQVLSLLESMRTNIVARIDALPIEDPQ